MIGAYYDIEIYNNFFEVTFLDINAPQNFIDEYIKYDILYLQERNRSIRDNEKYNFFKDAKRRVLAKMNIETYIISDWRNDLIALYSRLKTLRLYLGFNSLKYDNLIIDYIMIFESKYRNFEAWQINNDLYSLSTSIISNSEVNYKWFDEDLKAFKEPYTSIDLFALVYETTQRKSLKQTGISLKWHRIQDLPIVYNAFIKEEQEEDITDYNLNDVFLTRAMHVAKRDECALRVGITQKYGVNVLTNNRSTIADKLMAKFYCNYTGLKYYQFKDQRTHRREVKLSDIINPKITFKTKTMNDCLTFLMNHTILVEQGVDDTVKKDKDKSIYKVFYKDIVYKVAAGGLHSMDRPRLFDLMDNPDMIMRDADVGSYYPSLIINEGVSPAHLAQIAFNAIAIYITSERLTAKREGRVVEADALKIVANSGLFGKFGFVNGWLLDVQCVYQTTINGQLYLLMLIEELEENNIHVISANTDGVTAIYHKDQEELYYSICKEWERKTGFGLEYARYIKYARTSVNDYIAIKDKWLKSHDDHDIKRKGDFLVEPDICKGYSMPIVGIALDKYFVHGIPLDETIRNHTDIYDFCISVKTGEVFTKELHFIKDGSYCKESLQKNVRYFVSLNGGGLNKHSKTTNQDFTMAKGVRVTPFNDYYPVIDFAEYKVDYRFYLHKAYEMLYKVTGANIKGVGKGRGKGVKQIGTMFDII